jgi:hypothetical protein
MMLSVGCHSEVRSTKGGAGRGAAAAWSSAAQAGRVGRAGFPASTGRVQLGFTEI